MVKSTASSLTKEVIQEALKDKALQCRYYETIVNAITDLIALTDGVRVMDGNAALLDFFHRVEIDPYDENFSLGMFFEPIERFGYVYDGYQNQSWVENVVSSPVGKRVGIVQKGDLYTFNISLSPLEMFEGIYVMTLSDVTDMMGHKAALEEGIRSSVKDRDKTQFMLQQYDKAMEAATMVFKCDLEGVITYANRALCEALMYANGELIGKHLLTLRGKSISDATYASIWDKVTRGKIYRGVLELSDKFNAPHYLDVSLIPIHDQEKRIVEYFSLSHEITDAVEAKETAIKTLEAKNKFFDQASHELRTPLNAIINFTDSALESFDEMFLDEESKELVKMYIQRAHTNSQHLLELINSLLDMAKLRAGKETFTMVECDVVELAQGVYHSVLALNTNPDVEFDFEFPHEHLMIRCDVLKMRQILLNLVSNALKFTNKGSVTLRIRTVDETCRIEIEDTGAGIPQEKIEKIFEPFEQVSSTDQGTGLGLGIAHEYAKGMNMKLVVSSKEGLGSIFVINVPLVAIYT